MNSTLVTASSLDAGKSLRIHKVLDYTELIQLTMTPSSTSMLYSLTHPRYAQ